MFEISMPNNSDFTTKKIKPTIADYLTESLEKVLKRLNKNPLRDLNDVTIIDLAETIK
ncbi:MAG: hypothetical protein QX197_01235 [Methylococcaceae bacterium]